jgi:hypothetical protein
MVFNTKTGKEIMTSSRFLDAMKKAVGLVAIYESGLVRVAKIERMLVLILGPS